MKKITVLTILFACTAAAFAGGVDTKSNLSTGYYRNPSRNTESKRPEAVFYNIAGTGFMANGLYFEAGNQFVFKEYSDDYAVTGKTYKDNENVYLYPNADIVFKKDRLSFFGGFAVAGGGGELDYKDGTGATYALVYSVSKPLITSIVNATEPSLTEAQKAAKVNQITQGIASSHSLKVYSVTYGFTLGSSYDVTDSISIAAAARVLYGHQILSLTDSNTNFVAYNGSDELRAESFGAGIGGIFGVQYKPVSDLDLTVQYKTLTKLSMKYSTLKGTFAKNALGADEGDTFDNDMPPELNLGAGYRVIDPVYVSASFNYYFNSQANITNTVARKDYNYDDSWECALGVDWDVNSKLTASLGGLYSKAGSTESENNVFSPVLDNIAVGTGVEVKAVKNFTFTGGLMYTRYFEKDYNSNSVALELNKKAFMCTLGATWKPF